jgi:hypothetical protein
MDKILEIMEIYDPFCSDLEGNLKIKGKKL